MSWRNTLVLEGFVVPETLEEGVKDWLDAKWPFERIRFRERD